MRKKLSLTIALSMIFIIGLCSCSSTPTPTETTESFMTALKAQDAETLASLYTGGELDISSNVAEAGAEDEEIAEAIAAKIFDFDYVLSNEQIDGGKATVDVEVTTYAFGTALTNFMSDYMAQAFAMAFSGAGEEEQEQLAVTLFMNEINQLEEKKYTDSFTVSLSQSDDGWTVDEFAEDSEFYNALSGGAIDAINNLSEAYSFDEE